MTERLSAGVSTLWRHTRRCVLLTILLVLGLWRAFAGSLHHLVVTLAEGWSAAGADRAPTPAARALVGLVRAVPQGLSWGARQLAGTTARLERVSRRADTKVARRLS